MDSNIGKVLNVWISNDRSLCSIWNWQLLRNTRVTWLTHDPGYNLETLVKLPDGPILKSKIVFHCTSCVSLEMRAIAIFIILNKGLTHLILHSDSQCHSCKLFLRNLISQTHSSLGRAWPACNRTFNQENLCREWKNEVLLLSLSFCLNLMCCRSSQWGEPGPKGPSCCQLDNQAPPLESGLW